MTAILPSKVELKLFKVSEQEFNKTNNPYNEGVQDLLNNQNSLDIPNADLDIGPSADLNFEPKKLSERVSKGSIDPKNFEFGKRNNKNQER
jgi:hypothetical protein